jgi:O-antigen/teichoic acid export membrane protein
MLLPLLALAAIYRQYLHYLFGKGASPDFYFGILCFSPVYILFSMTTATLKGMLEIRWAQGLLRLVTFGSFGVYAALFVMARGFLVRRPAVAIWGTYLGLAAVGTLIGIHRILRLSGWHGIPRQWRPMLPGGFWRFLLATQQVGWVQMLGGRLDYVLILNYGGLAVLGKYVAVTAVATTVPTILRFFLDTLFPSLTNLVADRNLAGAQSVLTMQIRIVLAVCTAATCGLVLLASLFLEVLGPQYADLRGPVILMTWLLGLSSPLVFGGAVLAAFGKMQRVVWVGLIQVGVFAALFWALWTRWQLTAAVAANGIAVVISNLILFGLANRYLPVGRAEIKSYVQFAVVATVTAATVSYFAQVSTVAAIAIWLGTIGLFLLVGGYSVEECRELVRFYTPGRGGVPEKPALEQSEGKALVV